MATLSLKDIEDIAAALKRAGKAVVLSTLAVVSNEAELGFVRELLSLPLPIEANDMSVFNMVDPAGRVLFAGPHITTYNVPSIEFLQGIGIKRMTFPVELSGASVAYNIENTGVEAEIFAHGKVPLAFSWRCYTSRAFGLTTTGCAHDCMRFPDGMVILTMDGEEVFTINGTSVLSARAYTLAGEVEALAEMGVRALRVSPQSEGTAGVVDIFRRRMTGTLGAVEASAALEELSPEGLSNGWYHGRAGTGLIELINA
jgi:collagenase-like PrtC family protease